MSEGATIPQAALEWITGGDTGLSSITIFAALTGGKPHAHFGPSLPADGADFGRCYRLLKTVPEWRPRIPEVAERFPVWRSMVADWDKLERLYEAGDGMALYREIQRHWPRIPGQPLASPGQP